MTIKSLEIKGHMVRVNVLQCNVIYFNAATFYECFLSTQKKIRKHVIILSNCCALLDIFNAFIRFVKSSITAN
jgi:hypothetical protein